MGVHGPVVASVYHEYKIFKFNPIYINYQTIEFDERALEV